MRYVSGIDSLDDEFDVKSDNIKCIFDVLIYGFAFIAFLLCMNFSYELFLCILLIMMLLDVFIVLNVTISGCGERI